MLLALFAIGFAMPVQAAPGVAADRFERLSSQDLRVATVAYRLATANANQCEGMRAPQFGFVLHGLDQYALADRRDASRRFALGRRVGVMAVVAGSPAERAGLVAGDALISVNGRMLPTAGAAATPTRDAVDRAHAMLAHELALGRVSLRVSRADGERDVDFLAEAGCRSTIELAPGTAVNAWADGAHVMIGEGLLRLCASDADLALVIGHEMAHNLLRHRQRLAAAGVTTSALLPLTAAGSIASRETEEEADRFAIGLVAGAGYSLAGAELFVGGLIAQGPPLSETHPARERRLALLHAAIAETRVSSGL